MKTIKRLTFFRPPHAIIYVALLALCGLLLALGRPPAERTEARAHADAPEGMVLVEGGEFILGSDDANASEDERPLRTIYLDDFYIDRYEVTNREYKLFDPDRDYPEGRDDYPVTGVTLEQARAYAGYVGKRLPTAAEWEKAARGTDGRRYTWGNDYRAGAANLDNSGGLAPVGSYRESVSPYGAHDMIGNAWEWVDDPYTQRSFLVFEMYTSEVIKGGGYAYSPFEGRAAYNGFEGIGGKCNDVGFRCVSDP